MTITWSTSVPPHSQVAPFSRLLKEVEGFSINLDFYWPRNTSPITLKINKTAIKRAMSSCLFIYLSFSLVTFHDAARERLLTKQNSKRSETKLHPGVKFLFLLLRYSTAGILGRKRHLTRFSPHRRNCWFKKKTSPS